MKKIFIFFITLIRYNLVNSQRCVKNLNSAGDKKNFSMKERKCSNKIEDNNGKVCGQYFRENDLRPMVFTETTRQLS